MQPEADGVYSVDLLFNSPPVIDPTRLFECLRTQCPDIAPLGKDSSSRELFAYIHRDHPVRYKDGAIPAQFLVIPGPRPGDSIALADAVGQSWSEPKVADLVRGAPHQALVTDMMAGGLPYKERLNIYLAALEAVVRHLCPSAIHWRNSQQVRTPDAFLAARGGGEKNVLFAGPINVRMFRIANGAGPSEMVMDTRGLSVFGLPDLQCHFHSLEPGRVASLLYNLASYLFEQGDVIEDDHTVDGLGAGELWPCRHEEALLAPEREVLDILPGRYAAGGRASSS
jgi:hypothetical protein